MVFAVPFVRERGWGPRNKGKVTTKGNGKSPKLMAWGAGRDELMDCICGQLGMEMESAAILP